MSRHPMTLPLVASRSSSSTCQGKFPDKPFGSVFVHNLARETWAVERYEDENEARVPPIDATP